jgi:hypothetical protein
MRDEPSYISTSFSSAATGPASAFAALVSDVSVEVVVDAAVSASSGADSSWLRWLGLNMGFEFSLIGLVSELPDPVDPLGVRPGEAAAAVLRSGEGEACGML